MNNIAVKRSGFTDAFTRLGWNLTNSNTGRYDVWTSPNSADMWTVVPIKEDTDEFYYYQNKNIRILIDFLGIEENEFNFEDIKSQLSGYNYKIINKIINKPIYDNDSVPFELVDTLSNNNIDAFRFYYKLRMKGETIPIEDFKLHHTQKGSFILPISVSAKATDDNKLFESASHINIAIRNYLDTINNLVDIKKSDEEHFANDVLERDIDSKIVKIFLGQEHSIARIRQKYLDTVENVFISSNGSPILDYSLTTSEKNFPTVDISRIEALPNNYIEVLEAKEIEADASSIEKTGVKINVEVDSLDQNGSVKFSVFAINGEERKKPFKARSTKLTKNTLNLLTDAFKSREIIEISGDISKSKGKVGEIIADDFNIKPRTLPLISFDEDKN